MSISKLTSVPDAHIPSGHYYHFLPSRRQWFGPWYFPAGGRSNLEDREWLLKMGYTHLSPVSAPMPSAPPPEEEPKLAHTSELIDRIAKLTVQRDMAEREVGNLRSRIVQLDKQSSNNYERAREAQAARDKAIAERDRMINAYLFSQKAFQRTALERNELIAKLQRYEAGKDQYCGKRGITKAQLVLEIQSLKIELDGAKARIAKIKDSITCEL